MAASTNQSGAPSQRPRPLEVIPGDGPQALEQVHLEVWFDLATGRGSGWVTGYGPDDDVIERPGRAWSAPDTVEEVALLTCDLLVLAGVPLTSQVHGA